MPKIIEMITHYSFLLGNSRCLNLFKKEVLKNNNIKWKVFNIYSHAPILAKLYIRLRWVLFNRLEELENWIPKSGKILDLGCGYGIFANLLALKSGEREMVGIDYSKKRIEVAQKVQKGNNLKIEFIAADITKLKPERCDAITLIDVLYYLPFTLQNKLLKACYDILTKEGSLLIKDFDRAPFWKYLLFYLQEVVVISTKIYFGDRDWRYIFKGRFYVRDSSDMINLLKNIGFRVEGLSFDKGNYQSHFVYVCYK